MKTISIKSILFIVGLILLYKLNFGQSISKLSHLDTFIKPDSVIDFGLLIQSPKRVLEAYSFGESTHSNYNDALLLAQKNLTYYAQGMVDTYIGLSYFDIADCHDKFILKVKKTIIDLLDDGLYHVVMWGRYEITSGGFLEFKDK